MYSKGEEEVPQWETMIDGEHSYAHLAVPTASTKRQIVRSLQDTIAQ